jgi:hypothetical protein
MSLRKYAQAIFMMMDFITLFYMTMAEQSIIAVRFNHVHWINYLWKSLIMSRWSIFLYSKDSQFFVHLGISLYFNSTPWKYLEFGNHGNKFEIKIRLNLQMLWKETNLIMNRYVTKIKNCSRSMRVDQFLIVWSLLSPKIIISP